jgi:putative Mn2+ efflux pump MntP
VSLVGVLLALSLGLDVFAAGLAFGLAGLPGVRWPRVALLFAVLGGLMTVLGLLLGRWLGETLGDGATFLAGAVLIVVGGRALSEAWRVRRSEHDGDAPAADAALGGAPTGISLRPAAVLMTGLVVTLDKLAVGIPLGTSGLRAGPLLAYIVVQGFVFTLAGLALGRRLGGLIGAAADLLAGTVFVAIGLLLVATALRA